MHVSVNWDWVGDVISCVIRGSRGHGGWGGGAVLVPGTGGRGGIARAQS